MAAASRLAVLEGIRAAQDRGLQHGRRTLPPYSTALAEIVAGRKDTHWIWFVWPSLQPVRPNVQLPQYLLPDLATAALYLEQPVLRQRLLEISAAATAHLNAGVAPSQLFGSQHRYDAPKFHETMTAFLVAGRLCNAEPFGAEVEAACLAGIAAITQGGGLHAPTVEILLAGAGTAMAPEEVAAVKSLVAAHGVSPPPQTAPPAEKQPKQQRQPKQKRQQKQVSNPHLILTILT